MTIAFSSFRFPALSSSSASYSFLLLPKPNNRKSLLTRSLFPRVCCCDSSSSSSSLSSSSSADGGGRHSARRRLQRGWDTWVLITEVRKFKEILDLQVHSLATMFTLKMEIAENAWKDDLIGIQLANFVNSHLPKNIKVISILSSQRSFDARKECSLRVYTYLVPVEIIGIKHDFSEAEINHHLLEFNRILEHFEGERPFHNYTTRSVPDRSHS